MQAATFLYLVYAHNGLDILGLPYLSAAVEIGHTLGVFDPPESAYPGESDLADARLFTAWAVFRHTTYVNQTTSFRCWYAKTNRKVTAWLVLTSNELDS